MKKNNENLNSPPSSPNPKGAERRRWPRIEQKIPVHVKHAEPGRIARGDFSLDPVWTRDLGGGGLGLNAPVHCPIGETLDIKFGLPGRNMDVNATVTVVYSKQESGKPLRYRLGVSYHRIKEDFRQAVIHYVNDCLGKKFCS